MDQQQLQQQQQRQEERWPSSGRALDSISGATGSSGPTVPAQASLNVAHSSNVRTATATITTTQEQLQQEEEEVLTLTLHSRPSVTWDENVVDNEGLGRKSSKRCCIFHKKKEFGESSTESDSDYDDKQKRSGGDKKIARPKKTDKPPDFQRYHA